MTKKVDHVIKRKSIANPRKATSDIARELRDENLANVSRCTVNVTRRIKGFIVCQKSRKLDSRRLEKDSIFR